MKNIKLSAGEKRSIRAILLLTLIQLVIVLLLVHFMNESRQININDTKQIDITVDDIYIIGSRRLKWLFVADDSTRYLFMSRPTLEERSIYELYDSISKGDELSLIYYESNHIIFGNVNVVVDARTETEVYRTFDEYNRSSQGLSTFVLIVFLIAEFIFIGIAFVCVWLNRGNLKSLYKKMNKPRR